VDEHRSARGSPESPCGQDGVRAAACPDPFGLGTSGLTAYATFARKIPPSRRPGSVAGVLRLGRHAFGDTDLLVMAIVNRTRDSFYDRGATYAEEEALERVRTVVAEGADIVDVGGVRAGHGPPVGVAEELDRVLPVVEAVRERHPRLVISVDTWRAEVAEQACAAGAHLINDTWAGHDPRLPEVAARYGAGLVCSHTGGARPRTLPFRVSYGTTPEGVVDAVLEALRTAAARAVAAGVDPGSVLLDPTHDFGKNTWHSLALTRHTPDLVGLGHPVLMALSRKDFVGETLDLPVTERLEGTLGATAVAAWLGASVFRTHDVAATRRVLDMVAALRGDRPPARALRGLA
jgi:dihydropteroate synthase